MKKVGLVIVLLAGVLAVHSQNEKTLVVDANAEVRNVSGFKAIEVSDAIDLYLSQGNTGAVAISGSTEEIRTRIKTEVRNGTLHIYLDSKGINWRRWGNNRMKAYVTFATLEKLEASGACNVRATDSIRQPVFRMEMSGASDFIGDMAIGRLHVIASGASNLKIAGRADNAVFEATGACTIKAYDFSANTCKIDATGASNVRLTVNKELSASATGGSTIFFKGEGLIRDISSTGGASIKRVN